MVSKDIKKFHNENGCDDAMKKMAVLVIVTIVLVSTVRVAWRCLLQLHIGKLPLFQDVSSSLAYQASAASQVLIHYPTFESK